MTLNITSKTHSALSIVKMAQPGVPPREPTPDYDYYDVENQSSQVRKYCGEGYEAVKWIFSGLGVTLLLLILKYLGLM